MSLRITITDPALRVTTNTYNNMGQRTAVALPGSRSVFYEYYLTGELKKTYGSDTYPVAYGYDYAGRMKTPTYKDYASDAGAAITKWNYSTDRGFMTSKIYDDEKGTAYTYNIDGQIATRTWKRTNSSTGERPFVLYSYDNAGGLTTANYSDTTPDISYTRDRLGRPSSITDAAGTHNFTYNTDTSLASATLPHILNHSLEYTYDTLGRRTDMEFTINNSSLIMA